MSILQAHVFVSGRVQGVGYRASTCKVAVSLGLKGWVRNLPDGRVEAVFAGTAAQVEEMLRWCRQGPPAAIVDDVTVEYEAPQVFQEFRITR
jgi:acylphosphatase